MANNIFSEAKAYRKKHPQTTYQQAIQIVSGKRKPAKKKAAKKSVRKAAVSGVKKKAAKIKIKKTKRGISMSISGISMGELQRQVNYLRGLEKVEQSTKEMLKEARYKTDHPLLRRQLAKTKAQIASVKKHITALKRGI